jgi:hypothetical protein
MVKGSDVLLYLIPTGGWVISENDFESIIYDEGVKPITKKQFDDGFGIVEKIKLNETKEKEIQRQAVLDRLGITAEEAQLLLGGN